MDHRPKSKNKTIKLPEEIIDVCDLGIGEYIYRRMQKTQTLYLKVDKLELKFKTSILWKTLLIKLKDKSQTRRKISAKK